MAKKFFDIDEAAAMLGITPAALNDMRTRNEIRGFRDGTTWKFRSEELEKVSAELKGKSKSDEPAADESSIGLADEGPSEGGSVLLSERELGSGPTTSSTIIGKSSGSKSGSDSDIRLAESPRDSKTATSDVKLASTSGVLSEGPGAGSELGLQFEELDSLELDFDDSGKGKKPAAAAGEEKPVTPPVMAGDSNLSLGEEIAPPDSLSQKSVGSDIAGSAIDLTGDDDLVLGGSGSDVTGKPGDSGISLMDPSDSGLSLDEPMELGGSNIEGASLVLGEDDMITLGGEADVSAATQLRSDDDFLLTPSSTAGDESESGSQVIALDSLEGFDESPTQVAGAAASMRLLEEDVSGADTMVGGPGMIPAPAGMPGMQAAPGMVMAPAIPEAPYSIWNVLSLFVCVALLCVIGMMMYDMMRNIWSWDQAYPINSSLMDAMIDMFKK